MNLPSNQEQATLPHARVSAVKQNPSMQCDVLFAEEAEYGVDAGDRLSHLLRHSTMTRIWGRYGGVMITDIPQAWVVNGELVKEKDVRHK